MHPLISEQKISCYHEIMVCEKHFRYLRVKLDNYKNIHISQLLHSSKQKKCNLRISALIIILPPFHQSSQQGHKAHSTVGVSNKDINVKPCIEKASASFITSGDPTSSVPSGVKSVQLNPEQQKPPIQRFINHVKWILEIHRQETISNKHLWLRPNQAQMKEAFKGSRWVWINHTLRKPTSSITRLTQRL